MYSLSNLDKLHDSIQCVLSIHSEAEGKVMVRLLGYMSNPHNGFNPVGVGFSLYYILVLGEKVCSGPSGVRALCAG